MWLTRFRRAGQLGNRVASRISDDVGAVVESLLLEESVLHLVEWSISEDFAGPLPVSRVRLLDEHEPTGRVVGRRRRLPRRSGRMCRSCCCFGGGRSGRRLSTWWRRWRHLCRGEGLPPTTDTPRRERTSVTVIHPLRCGDRHSLWSRQHVADFPSKLRVSFDCLLDVLSRLRFEHLLRRSDLRPLSVLDHEKLNVPPLRCPRSRDTPSTNSPVC